MEESAPDADGIITVVSYRRSASGALEKVTQRIRRLRRAVALSPAVLARRGLAPFGEAASSNEGCTVTQVDELHFEVPNAPVVVKEEDKTAGKVRCAHFFVFVQAALPCCDRHATSCICALTRQGTVLG